MSIFSPTISPFQVRPLPLDQFVRIRLIEAPPFVIVVNVSRQSRLDAFTHTDKHFDLCNQEYIQTKDPDIVICGFAVSVILALQARMHFNYSIDLAPLQMDYHTLVSSVAGDKPCYDMVISDIRMTSGSFSHRGFLHGVPREHLPHHRPAGSSINGEPFLVLQSVHLGRVDGHLSDRCLRGLSHLSVRACRSSGRDRPPESPIELQGHRRDDSQGDADDQRKRRTRPTQVNSSC